MSRVARARRTLHVPITLSVILMGLNIALMVTWIVQFAYVSRWGSLAIGTALFSLILAGLVVYLILTIKEIRLNQRQANFVDSVTHELKSPIASLKLYLETLQLRTVDEAKREDFYRVMGADLQRLDTLINQLLEVGRLDAIAEQNQLEEVEIEPLLRNCASIACMHHNQPISRVKFAFEPTTVIRGARLALEMIFGNLFDNAFKYSGAEPAIEVTVQMRGAGRVVTRIVDNGIGVHPEIRKKIFQLFYRGGKELERTRKGTGLGLYIVYTLVRRLRGKVSVHGRGKVNGSIFEVELPGRIVPCES